MDENNVIPGKMRALVLDGTEFDHLQIREVPIPRPGPNQMLARIDAVGICTSLIKLVEQGSINVTGSSGGSPWDIAHTLDLMASGEIKTVQAWAAVDEKNYLSGQG